MAKHQVRRSRRRSRARRACAETAPCRTERWAPTSGAVTNRVGSIEMDAVVRVDHAAAERDRRDVPFAGGPQAEDEPLRPVRQARIGRGARPSTG